MLSKALKKNKLRASILVNTAVWMMLMYRMSRTTTGRDFKQSSTKKEQIWEKPNKEALNQLKKSCLKKHIL